MSSAKIAYVKATALGFDANYNGWATIIKEPVGYKVYTDKDIKIRVFERALMLNNFVVLSDVVTNKGEVKLVAIILCSASDRQHFSTLHNISEKTCDEMLGSSGRLARYLKSEGINFTFLDDYDSDILVIKQISKDNMLTAKQFILNKYGKELEVPFLFDIVYIPEKRVYVANCSIHEDISFVLNENLAILELHSNYALFNGKVRQRIKRIR